MSKEIINEEVLKVLNEKTANKENIRNFLIDLIFLEREQARGWHFKRRYQEILDKYTKKEGNHNEV
jgi:hypothetical protein